MHHGENETFSNSLCCSRRFASHAEGDQRYDLILDIGGNSSLTRLRRALVIIGGETGGRWLGEAPIVRSGRSRCPHSWARSWARL